MLISRNVHVSSPRTPAFRLDVAADVIEIASKMTPSQEDTTDKQVGETLARATARDEAKMFETKAPQKFTFPEMNTGTLPRSPNHCVYVRRQGRR